MTDRDTTRTLADIYAERHHFTKVHAVLVRMLDGDGNGAIVLAWLLYRQSADHQRRDLHADEDGVMWVRAPWQAVAEDTGLKPDLVRRRLERFVDIGLVRRAQGLTDAHDRAYWYTVEPIPVTVTPTRQYRGFSADGTEAGAIRGNSADGEPKAARKLRAAIRGNSADVPLLDAEEETITNENAAAAVALPQAPVRTRARTPRDDIWDAVAEACDWNADPRTWTKNNRALMGKVVTALMDAGATPEEVREKAQAYRVQFDTATLTPTALEKHWQNLNRANVEAALGVNGERVRQARKQVAAQAREERMAAWHPFQALKERQDAERAERERRARGPRCYMLDGFRVIWPEGTPLPDGAVPVEDGSEG